MELAAPDPPQLTKSGPTVIHANSNVAKRSSGRSLSLRLLRMASKHANIAGNMTINGHVIRVVGTAGAAPLVFVVCTCRVNGEAVLPLNETELGETLHVPADVATPLQLSCTVPSNPSIASTSSWYVAVCPAAMLAVVDPPAVATMA